MKVSWDWLKQYVSLDRPVEEMARRLAMSGLNHEATDEIDGDLCLDLEVTSNRPDCLGHIGIAREWAALTHQPLRLPEPTFPTAPPACRDLTSVEVRCPDLCPRYIARVIRGVRVGPSPAWMVRRLKTIGLPTINNVVDITNYVLMECGQPLHAFDYDKLIEHRIVVRRAREGETLTAIDGRPYRLDGSMCVIADAHRAVAVAGIMGGLETEIAPGTTTVLLESAEFQPLSVRRTSRAIGLSSESSFRFERGVDPRGVDWASRRACQLLVELAGGQVAEGAVEVGPPIPEPAAVTLPFALLKRILGIDIPSDEAVAILERLALRVAARTPRSVTVVPPTFRRDLSRPIDLVEEIGRLHGYEHVPETTALTMTLAPRSRRERVEAIVRRTLAGAGLFEAITYSFVDEVRQRLFSPWTDQPPVRVVHPSRKHENILRTSLVPSLLAAVRSNQARGQRDVDLFEIAHIYLPVADRPLPEEPLMLAIASTRPWREIKGVVTALAEVLHLDARLLLRPASLDRFEPDRGLAIHLDGRPIGWFGQVARPVADRLDLQGDCVVVELKLQPLIEAAELVPRYRPVSVQPAIERDLSLVVDEAVRWEALAATVTAAAGPYLEQLRFVDLYRGRPISPGKKSLSFNMRFRAADRTLTHEEVDAFQTAVLAACQTAFGAALRT